jgi:hypothetical protein
MGWGGGGAGLQARSLLHQHSRVRVEIIRAIQAVCLYGENTAINDFMLPLAQACERSQFLWSGPFPPWLAGWLAGRLVGWWGSKRQTSVFEATAPLSTGVTVLMSEY